MTIIHFREPTIIGNEDGFQELGTMRPYHSIVAKSAKTRGQKTIQQPGGNVVNKRQIDAYWAWIENHFYRDILLDLALLITIVSGIAIALAFFGS